MNNVFALTSPDELQTRADHGEAESQYRFAKKIFFNEGTHLDRSVAAKYFKMAADQNHPKGLNGYGACLEFGIGVEADMNEAARYYAASASLGDPLGQMNYAICLKNGFGMPKYQPPVKDEKKSINYEKILDELHQADLQKMREESMGESMNTNKVNRLSVALVDPSSIDNKGNSNSNGKQSFPIPPPVEQYDEYTERAKILENEQKAKQAATKNSKMTTTEISSLLIGKNEKKLKKEIKKPREIAPPTAYFKYAADNGEIEAESIFGRCLLRGEYGNRDFKEAERYLQMASKAGDTDAKRCFLYYSTINERPSRSSLTKAVPASLLAGNDSKIAKSKNYRSRSVLRQVTRR